MDGLLEAERKHELETEIVDLFPRRPPVGRLRAGLASRCRPAFCAAPVRGLRSRVVASWAPGAAVLRRRPPVPRHAFRLPRLLLCEGGRARRRSQCHCADATRRPGRPSRRLPERPHGGPANTAPGSSTRCLDHQRRAGLPTTAGIGSRVLNGGAARPSGRGDSAATTRSSTTTRRPARGSRTGRSTPAQASSSPQQATARLGALSAAAIRGVWGVASGERSLAPRPAHSRVCVPALRSPRRVECELVPGGTAAAGWGRRARTRRRRRRARRYQPRRAPADPEQRLRKKLRGFERRKCGSPSDGPDELRAYGPATEEPALRALPYSGLSALLSPLEWRGSRREHPVVGVRFVARGDGDQGRLCEGSAHEFETDREAIRGEASRYNHGGKATIRG